MISLRRSVSVLERLEALERASRDGFRSAVAANARHALELERRETEKFRKYLENLARRVGAADSPEELSRAKTEFLAALADQAERAARFVEALQKKVAGSASSLSKLADKARAGVAEDRSLQLGLGQLHAIAQDPDVNRVCPELNEAVKAVEASVERLREQTRVVIAQLRSEVASLRRALESAREEALRDPVSGLLNRNAVLEAIRERLKEGRTFSVLLIWIGNLQYIHFRYGAACRDDFVSQFADRLRGLAGEEAVVGRWGEDRFAVIVGRPKPEALWLSETLLEKFTEPFLIDHKGLVREVTAQIKTGVIEAAPQTTEAKLLADADKLSLALASIPAEP